VDLRAIAGNGRLQPWYFLRSWHLCFCNLKKTKILKTFDPTSRPNFTRANNQAPRLPSLCDPGNLSNHNDWRLRPQFTGLAHIF
jgi:hypothetical protein